MVQRILARAQMMPTVLAIAFNILCGPTWRMLLPSSRSTPSDLLVVSALCLAVSYTSDEPLSLAHWSRHVCDGTWTARRIDETMLKVLEALDWRLHEFTMPQAIEEAVSRLIAPVVNTTPLIRIHEPPDEDKSTCHTRQILRLNHSSKSVRPDG